MSNLHAAAGSAAYVTLRLARLRRLRELADQAAILAGGDPAKGVVLAQLVSEFQTRADEHLREFWREISDE